MTAPLKNDAGQSSSLSVDGFTDSFSAIWS